MSWGITFKPEVYLIRQEYSSIEELKYDISDIDDTIDGLQQRIMMFASSTPRDIIPSEGEYDTINYIRYEVNELLMGLGEAHQSKTLKVLYLNYLEEGNELVKAE